jgi:hypothetical protein
MLYDGFHWLLFTNLRTFSFLKSTFNICFKSECPVTWSSFIYHRKGIHSYNNGSLNKNSNDSVLTFQVKNYWVLFIGFIGKYDGRSTKRVLNIHLEPLYTNDFKSWTSNITV